MLKKHYTAKSKSRAIRFYDNTFYVLHSNCIYTIKNNQIDSVLIYNNDFFSHSFHVTPKGIITSDFNLIQKNNFIRLIDSSTIKNRNFTFEHNLGKWYIANNENLEIRDSISLEILNKYFIKDVYSIEFFKNYLILGSNGYGLKIINDKGIVSDTKYPGVCFNNLLVLNDTLFAATYQGIYVEKIDTLTQKFIPIQRINTSDGLLSNDILKVSVKNNKLWVLSSKGFEIIELNAIGNSYFKPPILKFSKILCNSSPVSESQFQTSNVFNYNQNNFVFSFEALSYYSLKNISYNYQLLGYDTTSYTTQDLFVYYTNLPSGNYTFNLSATNSHNIKSNTLTFNFTISQHFAATWWFKSRMLLLIIGAIFIILKISNKKREKLVKLKHEFAKLELRALQAQMNTHFIFNSLNAIQSIMFLKGEIEANKYITTFSSLIRKTLDNSKFDTITLYNEIEYLKLYVNLENYRFNNEIQIDFLIDEHLKNSNIELPTRIFQPIVENAFVHGLSGNQQNKKLVIAFSLHENMLIGEICDNGVGISQSLQNKSNVENSYKSWASTILQERIKAHNLLQSHNINFSVDYFDPITKSGTKVSIMIPINAKIKFNI